MNATEFINVRAWELRRKLFELVAECKALAQDALASGHDDAATEAGQQADAVACKLAEIHDSLPEFADLFIDAARDEKDQAFRI